LDDLTIKLNPLTKLRIYREVKKAVFNQMDRGVMSPDKAEVVLNYIKKNVVHVTTPEISVKFYKIIAKKFPELRGVEIKLDLETEEKVEEVIRQLVDRLMLKGDFELAEKIIDEVNLLDSKEEVALAETLLEKMPEEFKEILDGLIED